MIQGEFRNEKSKLLYNTGIDYALDLIGGKWKTVIIYLLSIKPRRTGELVKQLHISHKVLSEEMKQLIKIGLVNRKSYASIPPKVEYSLTEKGYDLYAVLRYLTVWGEEQATKNPKVQIMCTDAM